MHLLGAGAGVVRRSCRGAEEVVVVRRSYHLVVVVEVEHLCLGAAVLEAAAPILPGVGALQLQVAVAEGL